MCSRRSTSQMVYGLRSYPIGRHGWVSASTLLLWGTRLVAAATSKPIVRSLGRVLINLSGVITALDVRCTPGSGGKADIVGCLRCAKGGCRPRTGADMREHLEYLRPIGLHIRHDTTDFATDAWPTERVRHG